LEWDKVLWPTRGSIILVLKENERDIEREIIAVAVVAKVGCDAMNENGMTGSPHADILLKFEPAATPRCTSIPRDSKRASEE
jgi:hypothetical protein